MTIDKGAYVSDLIDLIPTCKVHANSKTGDSVCLYLRVVSSYDVYLLLGNMRRDLKTKTVNDDMWIKGERLTR